MEPKKYEYIDGLRGVAILMVLIIHNYTTDGIYNGHVPFVINSLLMYGRFGVQLFFLVSAFTLMLSHDSRLQEDHFTRNFYIRRIFRIVPMYYLALIYYSIDSIFISDCFTELTNVKDIIWNDFFRNAAFLNNFYPNMLYYVPGGWSIVVEMSFYLFLPFIWKYINNINKLILLLSVSLLVSVFFTYMFIRHFQSNLVWYFPNMFPIFLLGISVYYITRKIKFVLNKWTLVLLLASLAFYAYAIPTEVFRCFLASFLLFLFVLIIYKKQYKIIANRYMAYVGKISYSMYIIHFGVLYWLERLNFIHFIEFSNPATYMLNYVLRYVILLVLTILLSHFTYQYCEKFFIRKGKQFILFLNNKTY